MQLPRCSVGRIPHELMPQWEEGISAMGERERERERERKLRVDKWTGLRRQHTNYTTIDSLSLSLYLSPSSPLMSLCHIPEGCSSIRRHIGKFRSCVLCFVICSCFFPLALPTPGNAEQACARYLRNIAEASLVLCTTRLGHPHACPCPSPLPVAFIAHKWNLRLLRRAAFAL